MRWQITFFGLLLCGFFSFFGLSSSTYAVSDITVDYPANTVIPANSALFSNCDDSSCLSQYSYLIITAHNIDYSQSFGDFCFLFRSNSYTARNACFYPYTSPAVFTIPSGAYYNLHFASYSQNMNYSFTLTLTDSFGQSCPEPDPCPVVPDHPYDDKFDNIEKAIYVCGAILIMLYFFYCIYRMIIKGSGVN